MVPHRFTKMSPQKRKPPERVKPQDVPSPSGEHLASIRPFEAIRLLARLESLAANTDIAYRNNVCYFASLTRLIEATYRWFVREEISTCPRCEGFSNYQRKYWKRYNPFLYRLWFHWSIRSWRVMSCTSIFFVGCHSPQAAKHFFPKNSTWDQPQSFRPRTFRRWN